ncbi:MAG: nucleotide modification associated domain-containing protein [Candidatus Heimdallarchaeaceae archaeon]
MTRKQFLDFAKSFYDDAHSLMEKKNHDYSRIDNPFSNFEIQAFIAGVSEEKTFMMALGTKIARLQELVEKPENARVSESLTDTLADLCNYSVLLAGYLESKK